MGRVVFVLFNGVVVLGAGRAVQVNGGRSGDGFNWKFMGNYGVVLPPRSLAACADIQRFSGGRSLRRKCFLVDASWGLLLR